MQASEVSEEYCQLRQVVEHRLARWVQLWIRRASLFGRKITLFQLLMAAMVANLMLVANRTGQMTFGRAQTNQFPIMAVQLGGI